MTKNRSNSDSSSANVAKSTRRPKELVVCIFSGLMFICLALMMEPVRTGDGAYYFGMLVGLSESGSPAITESVRNAVTETTDTAIWDLTVVGKNGQAYATHFFAYSLLSLPAYELLALFNLDVFKAFQITNALIIFLVLSYILVFSRLSEPVRWFITSIFLFSTGSIYFQWTHPEVFSAGFTLVSAVTFVERKYVISVLMAAIASLQNPSIAFMIVPIIAGQCLYLSEYRFYKLFTKKNIFLVGYSIAFSFVSLIPYIWNYSQFESFSPIVSKGYIDYSYINLSNFYSFVFDLNQGLIIGLPALIWIMPMAIVFRLYGTIEKRSGHKQWINPEDFLLIAFVLISLPTLGQTNWNAGHSIFLRYSSWAGMVLLVWGAVSIGRQRHTLLLLGLIPAIVLQLTMVSYIGGIAVKRFPTYLSFMPWVEPLWEHNPHIYDPRPEIYFERLNRREGLIETPSIFSSKNGDFLRILTKQDNIKDAEEEVCGDNGQFISSDNEPIKIREVENGFSYVTGRINCSHSLPATLGFSSSDDNNKVLSFGWSKPESWGVWSQGKHSTLTFYLKEAKKKVKIIISGRMFVSKKNMKQVVEVIVEGKKYGTWMVEYPNRKLNIELVVDSSLLNENNQLIVELNFPKAISPIQLGMANDWRQMALGLEEVKLTAMIE